jgi:hypothetical protein
LFYSLNLMFDFFVFLKTSMHYFCSLKTQ